MNASNTVWGWGKRWDDSRRGKPDLPQHPALSDSMYYAASPEPERCPSGGCHRNIPQGGFNLVVRWESIVFKDNGMQIFRLKLIFLLLMYSVFLTCMSGKKIVWSVTSYRYNIYNMCQRFFCQVCASMHPLQCITFPGPPRSYSYIGLCVPRGILSDRCLLPNANWITLVWLSLPRGGVGRS